MDKKRMLKRIALALILIIILFWVFGVIPKAIGTASAKKYVSSVHSDKDLTFSKMEYSSSHGAYFAVFYSSDNSRINFLMGGGLFLPIGVWYDPLIPSG